MPNTQYSLIQLQGKGTKLSQRYSTTQSIQ